MPVMRMTPLLTRTLTRRNFSVLQRTRQLIRSAEPHPFERYPATEKMASPDYARLGKRLGDAGMLYVATSSIFTPKAPTQ